MSGPTGRADVLQLRSWDMFCLVQSRKMRRRGVRAEVHVVTMLCVTSQDAPQRWIHGGAPCDCILSGSCRCALIGVPCRLRTLSIFSTFDNMLKLTVSPQAKRAETDPRQGTYEGRPTTA